MNISFLFILLGCQSLWDIVDVDGDGTTILDGDCWEQGDPPQIEGALEHVLTANDIGVGKYDAPYDGIDANSDGKNDFDVDGDGYVPDQFQGIATFNIEEENQLPGGDCFDAMLVKRDDDYVWEGYIGEGTILSSRLEDGFF